MAADGRFCVDILSSRKYGTLYTGFTGDLGRRVHIHREGLLAGFSSRYKTYRLVYFEQHEDPRTAITREKQIKAWKREWKIELIERDSPDWRDLFDETFG